MKILRLHALALILPALLLLFAAPADAGRATTGENPMVVISTSLGDITVELYEDKAPITVKNFLDYIDEGFYGDTIFHRVIPGFMVQCGGMNADMSEKENKAPIKNEADNGLTNERGTLAMARTQVVDSATSQFFINLKDNGFLNHGDRDFGYAVFGKVVEGMDVVDKIAAVPTGNKGFHQDVPVEPVLITGTKRK
ncbi:MAG: peptidylprolyl isomerase [Magnetococcales bacterium]|nr:peptidylprolyl isomerase [Magnetococcales bacterium]